MGVTDHGDDLRRELERDRHGYTYGVIYTGQGIHPSDQDAFIDATASGFKVTIAGVEHGSRHQERWQAEATINAYSRTSGEYPHVWLRSPDRPLRAWIRRHRGSVSARRCLPHA